MMGMMAANDGREGLEDKSMMDIANGKPKDNPALDGWLTQCLGRLYGPAVDEPLPADLIRRLEECFK